MIKFGLRRKTGYISVYSLAMVWVAWRKGVHYQGAAGQHVAPMMASVFGQWREISPALVRPFSWLARKVRRLDNHGQVPRAGEHRRALPWHQ